MRSALFVLTLLAAPVSLAEQDLPARLDALYERREAPAAWAEADKLVNETARDATDYEVLWRLARHKYWYADGAREKEMARWGKDAWALAERAIKARPEGVEGHYYAAISIGVYSTGVGVLKALGEGLEGKYLKHLDKALSLDASYDNGGGRVAKGRYHYELPWPKRDLKKSRQELSRVLEKNPENLRAALYLAETELKDGNPRRARELNERALQGDEAYNPPEARRVKQWAQQLAPQIERELK